MVKVGWILTRQNRLLSNDSSNSWVKKCGIALWTAARSENQASTFDEVLHLFRDLKDLNRKYSERLVYFQR